MTVVFRPASRDPAALDEPEAFDNGERIPDALIHTAELPKGFPTERFAPRLFNGRYAIRVDIEVAPGKLLLSRRYLRGHMDAGQQPLSYVVFAKQGLPLSIPVYEPDRGLVDTPGRLFPLPLEPKTPGR